MKIKLIVPSRYLPDGRLLKSRAQYFPSLTLPLLAALAPADCEVSITDDLIEDIDFDEDIDLVGITSYTFNIQRAYKIADQFRERRVYVVMGGIHVTFNPEEARAHCETVILGEAEETWPQFLHDLQKGVPQKIYRPTGKHSLANLPIPRFSLLNQTPFNLLQDKGIVRLLKLQFLPLQTSRGCPHRCEFCSVAPFHGGRYRTRPIGDVVREIRSLKARNFFFYDDNIMASPGRARELFRSLIPLKIKWLGQATINAAQDIELIRLARKSGCLELSIGMESLSQKHLDAIGKAHNVVADYEKHLSIFKKEGITVSLGLMFGYDDDEPSVFRKTYEFLLKNRIPYTVWELLKPYPGTALYHRLKQEGRLKDESWWLKADMLTHCLAYTGIKMDEDQFFKNFYHYSKKFYSLKSIFQRIMLPPQPRWPRKIFVNLILRKIIRSPDLPI